MPRLEVQIPDIHRGERAGRAPGAGVLPGNDAGAAGAVRQRHLGDLRSGDALVAGGRHLVPGRQVDPQLQHLEVAALPGEFRAVELLVDQARGRGHPLHVTGANAAPAPRRVPVRHPARMDDGHRLEPPVRMRPDAEALAGGREFGRAGVVQQQEGRQLGGDVAVREDALHRETVANPVTAITALDECQLLHDCSPLVDELTLDSRQDAQ